MLELIVRQQPERLGGLQGLPQRSDLLEPDGLHEVQRQLGQCDLVRTGCRRRHMQHALQLRDAHLDLLCRYCQFGTGTQGLELGVTQSCQHFLEPIEFAPQLRSQAEATVKFGLPLQHLLGPVQDVHAILDLRCLRQGLGGSQPWEQLIVESGVDLGRHTNLHLRSQLGQNLVQALVRGP
ncbi:MAG: hypothetical protein IPG83_17935 [Novosphingobium sp.]|nr:hypothetical protein [Novosphingobium sp.]